MKVTVSLILVFIGIVLVFLHAIGKAPLWPSVLCALLVQLLQLIPAN